MQGLAVSNWNSKRNAACPEAVMASRAIARLGASGYKDARGTQDRFESSWDNNE